MIKRKELSDPNSQLNKAAEDEPLFVLRAHDKVAPAMIRQWCRNSPDQPAEKREEAMKIADEMDTWHDAYVLRDRRDI